jgi:putative superfamily III holin-X
MSYSVHGRPIPEIVMDLMNQFPTLVRKESRLARAEVSEKITQVGIGLGFLISGAVLLVPALVVLLEACVAALQRAGFEPAIAALIAGGAAFLVGIILALIGINRMKMKNLVPEKTLSQFQQDASMAKRQVVRSDDEYQRAA